ncbi:hypothetical protein RhiirA1_402563 [Rhizophagus irregularis]|uniref:Replication origin-binding protein domain-containing protein n=1 Tax=Rhizophagus irregularis TaxID=588596 RepID=A0A2N0QXS5_9GLOM|nr:hypothetical protein RhiirA1_402563 [Rhizophagus irregularis]
MYTSTISDQTDRGTLARYDGANPGEYLNDSVSYNNDSDCRSDDYNNYESNYESDNEKAPCASTSTTEAVKERKVNVTYTLRQENFNNKFSPKDLLNTIRGILSSSPRDMSDDKGSLDCLPIYSFLFPNEKGSTLLIDHHELKAFTELVYTITGEKFGKYIDRRLPGQNFNLRLIRSAKKGRVKRILQFSLDNDWNELDHVRVQPPPSLGLEVRPQMLSEEKNNNPLRIIVGQDVLQKCANLVLQKHSNYLRDWTIEEKDSENFVYFNRKGPLECPLCKRIHDKDQWEVFECDRSIAEKIQQENKNSPQSFHKVKALGFPKAFIKMPSWVKYIDPLTATETYEERYVRSLPNEGDIYVKSPWEIGKTYVLKNLVIPDDVNLLVLSTRHSYSNAVTTRLNLRSYFDIDGNINLPDHKRVVCQIESLHRIVNKCKCNKKCKYLPIQYDLWLDEIVSIIAQAQSRLAGQSIERLYKLIQEARQIIVMDNDLTDLNIEWIKPLRKDKPFSVIYNTYQPQNGKTFRLAPNKDGNCVSRTLGLG